MSEKERPITSQEQALPEPGSHADLRAITRGFALISQYRKILASAEKAPMYSAGGYNQDGEPYDIEENLAPWEAVDKAADALAKSQAAIKILKAHKFTLEQVSPEGGTVIRNTQGDFVRSHDIPLFVKEKKDRPIPNASLPPP